MYWLLIGNLKSSLAQEQSDRWKLILENSFLWEECKVYNMECYKNAMFKALLTLYVLWVENNTIQFKQNSHKLCNHKKGWQVQLEKYNMVHKIWIHFSILYQYKLHYKFYIIKITLNANMIKTTHR